MDPIIECPPGKNRGSSPPDSPLVSVKMTVLISQFSYLQTQTFTHAYPFILSNTAEEPRFSATALMHQLPRVTMFGVCKQAAIDTQAHRCSHSRL